MVEAQPEGNVEAEEQAGTPEAGKEKERRQPEPYKKRSAARVHRPRYAPCAETRGYQGPRTVSRAETDHKSANTSGDPFSWPHRGTVARLGMTSCLYLSPNDGR